MPKVHQIDKATEEVLRLAESENAIIWDSGFMYAGEGPRNALTGHQYQGWNAFNLNILGTLRGYEDPRFVTYLQAKSLGGFVPSSSSGKGIHIAQRMGAYPSKIDKDSNGESVLIPRYKWRTVWNVGDCEELELEPLNTDPIFDPIAKADSIAAGYANGPEVVHAEAQCAHYVPSVDRVVMPPRSWFGENASAYYSTLFHELGHSTGHPDRLDRKIKDQDKHTPGEVYGLEELVAEFTSLNLCNHAGVKKTRESSVHYLAHWLRVLRKNKRMLHQAVTRAEKATQFILGKNNKTKEEEER